MDKNWDDQLFIMQATIDNNRQDSDEKMKDHESKLDKPESKLKNLTEIIKYIMEKNQY